MMFGSTHNVRVFAWPEPVDLRRGFDGLLLTRTPNKAAGQLPGRPA